MMQRCWANLTEKFLWEKWEKREKWEKWEKINK